MVRDDDAHAGPARNQETTQIAKRFRMESTTTELTDRKESAPSPSGAVRRPDLSIYEIDDELLIYDETSGDTHRLNGTARFIWDRCDGTRDARAIAADLADVYDVAPSEAVAYIERFFATLRERRLLVAAD